MLWDIVFWLSLVAGLVIGGIFFRDLGDVSQMVVQVNRDKMIRAIRNEKRNTIIGLGLLAVMAIAHLGFGSGPAWAFWLTVALVSVFFWFPLRLAPRWVAPSARQGAILQPGRSRKVY